MFKRESSLENDEWNVSVGFLKMARLESSGDAFQSYANFTKEISLVG